MEKIIPDDAHSHTSDTVIRLLDSRLTGLTDTQVQERLKLYGFNRLTPKNRITPLAVFLSQFKNTLTLVLLAAVGMVLFVYFFGGRDQSELIEALLILSIVLMIVTLGFIQEYKAEKALDSLKKLLSFKSRVIRNDKELEIDVIQLVPGDIVLLEEGMKTPADIRLISVANLYVNESSLTGESTTVEKDTEVSDQMTQLADRKNMVFAGTVITQGRGKGIVISTGDNTEIGKIAGLVAQEKQQQSPLQRKLNNIGSVIGRIVTLISVIVFIFIGFFAKEYQSLPLLEKITHSFIAAVALAVAAIPEGLPAVVTIALAIGTQRMAKKNALVRKLNAVETLGAVDVICTDKTGTLTKNEMTVRQIYSAGNIYSVSGDGFDTRGDLSLNGKSADFRQIHLLLEAGLYANNAFDQNGVFIGDPTEIALLVSARKASITNGTKRVLEIPFSSERKIMSVVVKKDGKYFLFSKGAPEILLSLCKNVQENKLRSLTDSGHKQIQNVIDGMSRDALRVLGFACKEINQNDLEKAMTAPERLENDMTFLGLQAMIDPPRKEVGPLIAQCKASGIRVIMITGDHEITARAIAQQIGITGRSITGQQLEKLNDSEFGKIIEDVGVYARINPSAKMRIVSLLKAKKHLVAMTGDGVNDAPALKKADIGIAMGRTGTDVAKEAAQIVLLDDKFSTIVHAIEEGRGIYQNIRKFVHYLLACNIGEVLLVFVGIILLRDLLLSATMLLWINVVTDGLPAVALALDKPVKGIFSLSPKQFHGDILTKRIWLHMLTFAVVLTGAILGIYFLNGSEHVIEAKGAAFIAIAFFEMVYLFVIRQEYESAFFSNKWLVLSVIVTIILQILIVYLKPAAKLFNVSHIDFSDWLYIVLVSGLIWIIYSVILNKLLKDKNQNYKTV